MPITREYKLSLSCDHPKHEGSIYREYQAVYDRESDHQAYADAGADGWKLVAGRKAYCPSCPAPKRGPGPQDDEKPGAPRSLAKLIS